MNIRNLAILSAFSFLLSSHYAYCSTAYLVTLSNGNVLEANSYTVEKGKAYLKYPVGEAAIPLSRIVSIKAEGGNADLLQSEGKFTPHDEARPPQAVKPITAVAASPEPLEPTSLKNRDKDGRPRRPSPEERKKAAAERAAQARKERDLAGQPTAAAGNGGFGRGEDPQVAALIDQMLLADETQQADLEKQLEKMIDGDQPDCAQTATAK